LMNSARNRALTSLRNVGSVAGFPTPPSSRSL
jgi:hypothetical protein